MLLVPIAVAEFVLSIAFPFVGTVAGSPLDIGADWAAILLLTPLLVYLFPAHLRAKHYQWIFRES